MRLVALLLVVACSSAKPDGPEPARAFYYWRTVFQLSPAEQQALGELHVTRLYVRMFDADEWGDLLGKVIPTSPVPAGIEVVPVVFLRSAIFKRPPADLAAKVWAAIEERMRLLGATPHELQLDCDWTDTTRDAYFAFVKQIRALSHLPLSATIRLHQIKYVERTGVPPVERGTLMFYNMGKLTADPTVRAIFDEATARKYLDRAGSYPLPLDAALPIWAWVVHVRDGQVVGLLESATAEELADLDFVTRSGPDRYTVTRAAFLHGAMLRDGDVLKTEAATPDDTLLAARMLASRLPSIARTVTLFDLSERNLARHGTRTLDDAFRALR